METAIWLNRQSNLQLVIRSQEQNFSLISSQLKKKYPSAPMWHIIFLQDEWSFSIFFFSWSKIRSAETNQSCHSLGKRIGIWISFLSFLFLPSTLAPRFICKTNGWSFQPSFPWCTAEWRGNRNAGLAMNMKKFYLNLFELKTTISCRIATWTPAATNN